MIPFANDTYTSSGDSLSVRNNATWLQSVGEASTLELKVGTTHERRERGSTILFDDGGDRAASMQLLQFRDDSRASTANAKLKTSFADKHTVVMGIEIQDACDDAARANFLDAVSQLANIGTGFAIRTRRHAIYAQDEWDISPRWSLYLGARWERVALRSENDLGRRGESARAVFSPIVHTVWRLPGTKQDQVRLGLARTWRLPSGENLIAGRSVANVNAVTTPDTSGNPDLRAELAWGLDAAYEHYLGKQGMVSVSAFVRRIDDVVVTRTMQVDGRWLAMPVNEGSATSRGIEIELKGKLTQLVSGAPALDLRANLARSWSSIAAVPGPHNRIGRQAPLSLNLGVDCGVKAFPLTVGGAFGYVRNGEVRVSAFESGYHADNRNLEAYALWKLHPGANLRLSAANLLRRDDVQESRYTGDGLALRKAVLRPTHGVVRAIMEFKF